MCRYESINIRKQKKRRSFSTKIIIAITIILMLTFLAIYPVLFQEGNPIPIVKGIMTLNIREDKIVQISEEPKVYITKTEEGISPITESMKR